MRIKGWERFQHYKSGPHAEKPPEWIKLYPRLLNDLEWNKLSGDDAKALMGLWMLASEHGGALPCVEKIAFRLRLSEKQVKSMLSRLGHWIEDSSRDPLEPVYTASSLEEENKNKKEEGEVTTSQVVDGVSPLKANLSLSIAFENYNATAEAFGLRKAERLTAGRRTKLEARLREYGLEGWQRALAGIADQPFLLGEGDKGWKMDFDFLLQPSSFQKVLEKAYVRRSVKRGVGALSDAMDEIVEKAREHDAAIGSKKVVAISDYREGGERISAAPSDVEPSGGGS
jgi:hypothetical protein